MLSSLRARLTLWFVFLSLLLYTAGGISAIIVFDAGLTASLDEELRGLSSEILPSIEFVDNVPSLRHWADTAATEHLKLPAAIQLFDAKKHLKEQYGPAGIPVLSVGTVQGSLAKSTVSVRSTNEGLVTAGTTRGFLQVQVSTKHRDHAVRQFALTLFILAPFVAIAVGICGYLFSGKAVKPVEETLKLLRRFVADAGHELNTPITVIEASLQTLEATLNENNIPVDVLDTISRASSRMKDLAANLILLARIESPALIAPKAPISIQDIVNPVLEELSDTMHAKDIVFILKPLPLANNKQEVV